MDVRKQRISSEGLEGGDRQQEKLATKNSNHTFIGEDKMKKMLVVILSLVSIVALMLPGCAKGPASPAEPFKVGMTASMTGRMASGYLPVAEGFRIYIQKLNDAGGIDGRKIELYLEDDRSEGGLSISNVRKFTERGVNLLVSADASALYEGLLAAAKEANIPIMFLGIGGLQKLLPPTPEPLMFASSIGFGGNEANSAILMTAAFLALLKPPFKTGVLTIDSPSNRWFFPEYYNKLIMPKLGLEPAFVQYVSPAAPDPKPFALKFSEYQVDAINYLGPAAIGLELLGTLRQLGWTGVFNQGVGTPPELMMENLKGDPKALFVTPMTVFQVDLPEHRDIKAAAEKYGATSINSLMIVGWTAGQAVTEILKRTGFPATTDNLLNVMNNFKYSLRPLKYGVEWTSTDHAGPDAFQHWHWDTNKGEFVPLDWIWADSPGLEYKVIGPKL